MSRLRRYVLTFVCGTFLCLLLWHTEFDIPAPSPPASVSHEEKESGRPSTQTPLPHIALSASTVPLEFLRAKYEAASKQTPLVLFEKGGKEKVRSSSDPFITGDGFRICSDVICDETNGCKFSMPPAASSIPLVVFVKTDMLHLFDNSKISQPYVLITHNSDYTSPWEPNNVRAKNGLISSYEMQKKKFLDNDPHLLVWYGQNYALTAVNAHPKMRPLPIGIENRYNKFGKDVSLYWEWFYRIRTARSTAPRKLLYVNFNMKTNVALRKEMFRRSIELQKQFPNDITIWDTAQRKLTLNEYLSALADHAFVLAPLGHGLDTHRVWEALYMGAVPVVMSSPLDELYKRFPVVILKGPQDLTVERLRQNASSYLHDSPMLFLSAWCEEFRQHR